MNRAISPSGLSWIINKIYFSKLKFLKAYNSVRSILYGFLFACSIEEIDDSRGLGSDKIKMDENLISAVETSMEDDK